MARTAGYWLAAAPNNEMSAPPHVIRLSFDQFIACFYLAIDAHFERQTPENIDALDSGSFLDLLADLDAYKQTPDAVKFTYTIVTSVISHHDKDPMLLPTRTARLELTGLSDEHMTWAQATALIALFEDYIPDSSTIEEVAQALIETSEANAETAVSFG